MNNPKKFTKPAIDSDSTNKTETEEEVIKSAEEQKEYTKDELEDIKRLEKKERIMDAINKLKNNEQLEAKEKGGIAAIIERINGAGIYNELAVKDCVATFMVPSGGALAIKNMNDNIFGNQTTDIIIAKRRGLVERYLKEAEIDILEQTFKTDVAKVNAVNGETEEDAIVAIDEERGIEEVNKIIKGICQRVDTEMQAFIAGKITEELSKPNISEKRRGRIAEFSDIIKENGYRVTYGLAQITKNIDEDDKEDMSNIELGLAQSAQAALVARREKKEYGKVFEDEYIMEEFRQINALRGKIISALAGQPLTNDKGASFEVFLENDGIYEMDTYLMRSIRKGKFKLRPEDKEKFGPIVNDLAEYLRRINVLDIMKPFTHEEINGSETIRDSDQKFSARMQEQKDLSVKLVSDNELDEQETQRIIELVENNPKNEFCTSDEKFHADVLKIKNCTYIQLDRLDLGVDLLKEFEQLQQKVLLDSDTMELRDASVKAGNAVTQAMRDMRQTAHDEFKRIFPEQEFLTLVGGDELTICIDNDKVKKEDVEELLFSLYKETNSRVIQTVITETMRNSEGDAKLTKLEHLQALKRVEAGNDISKKIEEGKRDLEIRLRQSKLGKSLPENELDLFEIDIINALDLNNFVIVDDERDGFRVKSKRQNGELIVRSPDMVNNAILDVFNYMKSANVTKEELLRITSLANSY